MLKHLLLITLILHLAQSPAFARSEAAPQPNILLIMVDDMGYSDLGCYGGEINTPNIDKLAANGLRFSNFYNTGRCWPTRSALLTGYYPQQINRDKLKGLSTNGARGKRPGWAQLLPTYLKQVDYRAYHSGKWHIDGDPLKNGFDTSFSFSPQDDFFDSKVFPKVYEEFPEMKSDKPIYATTAITDHAIGSLKSHKKNHDGKPFFSYVAYTAPHFPLHAIQEDIDKVGDRYTVGWEKIRSERWKKLKELGIVKQGELSAVDYKQGPPYQHPKHLEILGDDEVTHPMPWAELTDRQKKFQSDKMAIHAAMIERVDSDVGRLVDQLKEMGTLDNTLIMFLSDNGASAEIMVRGNGHDPEAPRGSGDSYLCLGPGWSTTCNTPFKKHKSWTHEGGVCTPLIVHWPNAIKEKNAIRHSPGHVVDVVPTILGLASLRMEPRQFPFQGHSIVDLLYRDEAPKRTIWYSHENNNALRDGDWKLVKTNKGDWELYNLAEDRAETINLAAQNPEKVQLLEKKWNDQVEAFREGLK